MYIISETRKTKIAELILGFTPKSKVTGVA